MTNWKDIIEQQQKPLAWPYPIRYEEEQTVECDVLVLGGGIAGCWAAISAARNGAKVVLVEKSATIRSGAGGPGCDHWCDTAANPLSRVDPDTWAKRLSGMPFANGIGRQIQCRENYDTLLEMEQMGGKIRDIEGDFKDEQGYDPGTKFLISPRSSPNHDTNIVIRIWGTTFKPALRKESLRLGVRIFDRTMATSLLTENGVTGGRVIGATGVNARTGEFTVFKSKATILAMSGAGQVWVFSTELAGYSTMHPRAISGDGNAMAWKAGAELTLMERSGIYRIAGGYKHKWYTGAGDASYENVPLVDANGKKLAVFPEPSWGVGPELMDRSGFGKPWTTIREALMKGEYELPFYGDFPAMNPAEANVTWNMLLQEESTTKIIVDTFNDAGFNPSTHQLQSYQFIEGASPAHWRDAAGGGLVVDWDLRTSLEGLYAAGTQTYSPGDHSYAASTGRYAGRKAAAYARDVSAALISNDQVVVEKALVYAPIKRSEGLDWKELHFGIARTMQFFCSEYKTERLFKMGLDSLEEIQQRWVPNLFAYDPHKLVRCLEDLSILTYAQIILNASLARKASSSMLGFNRLDYPQLDPPEWNRFLTVRLDGNDKVTYGEKPLDYAGDLKREYEARNGDYTGVYRG